MSEGESIPAANAPKKSSRAQTRRLPRNVGVFSVNFCRNAQCRLFGIPPDPYRRTGQSPSPGNQPHGKITGAGDDRSFFCPACGLAHAIKSNHAIAEEYSRLSDLYRRTKRETCPNAVCGNHRLPIGLMPSAYRLFGKTAKGDVRYQCKACRKTFSLGLPTRRHKKTDKTGTIMRGLVNKMAMSRLCEAAQVTFPHIHSKIDFLFNQCLAFAGEREARLHQCFEGKEPFFSTDAQTILVNWPIRNRRGTVPLLHMATVHKSSQFVVAATIDYDPDVDPDELEKAMDAAGDFARPRSMRRFARLWPASEYRASVSKRLPHIFTREDLAAGGKYELPGRGSRVRGDIFHYAHMMLVRKLVGRSYRVANFCVDAESGLANAIAALSVDEVKRGRVNIAEISFSKGLTNDERAALAVEGRKRYREELKRFAAEIAQIQVEYPDIEDEEALAVHILRLTCGPGPQPARGKMLATIGLDWPYHSKAEPEKTIRLKTDIGLMDWDGLAKFMTRASIHPVDAYFNLARRRIAGFERGLPTASNRQRIWHAYSFYNPEMVPKLATILRFYHNYMLPRGKEKATPAMKLGLARGIVYERDLFGFG